MAWRHLAIGVGVGLGAVALFAGCEVDDRNPGGFLQPPLGSGSGSGGSSFLPLTTSSASTGVGGGGDVIEDPDAPCDTNVDIDSTDPVDGAKALGICKQATDDTDWGLVGAKWVSVDGSAPNDDDDFDLGHGLLESFGTNDPVEGKRFLALSSGTAREPGDPSWESPAGYDKEYTGDSPKGFPKESPSCKGVVTGETHDDVALEITLRAPPNASSLAFEFNFFTFEWPNFICSQFNDFFVALMDPIPDGLPDGNISFDQLGNPVSVNNAFVRVCDCEDGPPCDAPPLDPTKSFDCELGPDQLLNTGFENHAATGWLVTRAPVVEGSEVTIRFGVYDSGDGVLDSTTIIDNFRWQGEVDDIETKPQTPK